jgi:tRNA G46 methylase TrmB
MEISIQRDRHRREHLEPQQQPQQAYRREQQRQLYRDRDRVGHPPRHSNNHGGRSRGGVRGNPQVFKQQLPEKYAKFGAYHNYYSRRNADRDRFIENDYRCQAIRDEYINEKVCLDIGCNEGLVGINLAVAYGSREMWGIDVDPTLIQKAENNLKQRKEEEKDKWSLRQSERERERETRTAAAGSVRIHT